MKERGSKQRDSLKARPSRVESSRVAWQMEKLSQRQHNSALSACCCLLLLLLKTYSNNNMSNNSSSNTPTTTTSCRNERAIRTTQKTLHKTLTFAKAACVSLGHVACGNGDSQINDAAAIRPLSSIMPYTDEERKE